MTDFPGFIENVMAGDNVEDSQQDENVILYSHWLHICAAGIAAASAVCIAWLAFADVGLNSNDVGMSTAEKEGMRHSMSTQLASGSQPSVGSGKTKGKRKAEASGTTKMKRKATADVILQSAGEDIVSSLDNVSRAIIKSAEILANKMSCPHNSSRKLFTSLESLELSEEYLIECYFYLSEHEAAANKFLGIPQQFRKEMLTRIMNSASLSK